MIGAVAILARPGIVRVVRTPRAWAFSAAWCALALAIAGSVRSQGMAHGADRVLLDAYGAIVLPLLAFGLVGALVGSGSLRASVAPLVAFGARPALATASTILVAIASSAVVGSTLAAGLAILAHGSGDPPLALDALASAYAGALGGAAYGSLFAMGAAFGRRGGGRALLLALDWILGASGGAASLLTPRAHVQNLLGGAAPMLLPGTASAAALAVLTVAYLLVAVWRGRR